MTNKGLSKMSRGKIKKLSTGVQNFAPAYSEKLCTPNNYNTQRIKKRKRKKRLSRLESGERVNTADHPKNPPILFWVSPKTGKAKTAVLAFTLWKSYMQKTVAVFQFCGFFK